MASIGNLVVNLSANNTALQRGLQQSQAIVSAAGAVITTAAGAALAGITSLGMSAERTAVSFEVMLGSAEKARTLISNLNTLGAESPFGASDFKDGAKVLLQFGVAGEQLIPTLRSLGDVAAGDAEKLSRLTLAFGQMTAAGRLTGQDLLQFVNAGFNPLQEIAKRTGETMIELRKRMEGGAIASAEVGAAFRQATSEGGRFFGMTERINNTAGGQFMRLKDSVVLAATSIGEQLMPAVQKLLRSVIPLVDKFAKWGMDLIFIGTAVGAFVVTMKALSLATLAYAKAIAFAQALGGPKAWLQLGFSVATATGAVLMLEAAMGDVRQEIEALKPAQQQMAGAFAQIDLHAHEAALEAKGLAANLKDVERTIKDLQSPTQKIIAATNEFATALARAGSHGVVTDLHPLVTAFAESESGFTDMMSSMQDQLDILTGKATEAGIALRRMAESGVATEKIEAARKLSEEIDRVTKAKDGKQFMRDRLAQMQAEADAIVASLMTPAQKLAAETKRINELLDNGLLNATQAQAAIEQARKDIMPAEKVNQPQQPRQAGAMERGSAEAFQAIVAAMNDKNGGGMVVQQKETNALLRRAEKEARQNTNRIANQIKNTKPGFLPEIAVAGQ